MPRSTSSDRTMVTRPRPLWWGVVLLSLGASVFTAAAQPITPDAAECTVAPRSLGSLLALNATPAAPTGQAVLSAATSESALPAGLPADPATVAEITAAARLYVACVNAWDLPRLLALRSDTDVARFIQDEGPVTAEWYANLATPLPVPPGAGASLLAVRDARQLPDGRVGAIVHISHPQGDTAARETMTWFVFVRADTRWLIDSAVRLMALATPAP